MRNMEEDSFYRLVRELRFNGIHSILVNTWQEAKNFIMYHVGVETIIFLDNSDEVNQLAIEKTAVNNGATIYDINLMSTNDISKEKSNINEIIIYGFFKFLDIVKNKEISDLPVSQIKIVIVIQMKMLKEIYLKHYNEDINIVLMDFQEIIKINKRDISIIFIQEE